MLVVMNNHEILLQNGTDPDTLEHLGVPEATQQFISSVFLPFMTAECTSRPTQSSKKSTPTSTGLIERSSAVVRAAIALFP